RLRARAHRVPPHGLRARARRGRAAEGALERGVIVRAVAVVAAALLAPACAHGFDGYQDALGAWRAGERARAVAITGEEYARWRDGNHLEEAQLRRLADDARERLEEVPMAPRGPRGAAPPPGVAGDGSLAD